MLAPIPLRRGAPAQPWSLAERRRHSRAAPRPLSLCRLEPLGGPPVVAFVRNLSASGIALYADAPLRVGAEVRLALVNNAAIFGLTVRLTVLRCQPSPTGDWLIAGMFDRTLRPAELAPFIM